MTAPTRHCSGKALQLLTTGRVRLTYADATYCTALVRGSQPEPYVVAYIAPRWRCSCLATVECSHIAACRAVWSPQPPPPVDRAERVRRGEAAFARIGAPTREDDEL